MEVEKNRIDRLYHLLPALHRMRDHEHGEPLRALLQVIGEQANLIQDDIAQLYENWFIETCDDWVVPYIGALVGYESLHDAGEPGDVGTEQSRARNRILIPRREVANTIRNRRRKGTLALLELLARDVSGWAARAVEFHRFLAQTASVRSFRAARGRSVDLRGARLLREVGTAFDALAHLADVRRINSRRTRGRYNVPAVGLFVWRLGAYSVTDSPAACIENAGPHCFTFSALGNDAPLFNRPKGDPDDDAVAGPLNVPAPISRLAFSEPANVAGRREMRASRDYYGLATHADPRVAQSLAIWADDWPPKEAGNGQPIPASRVVPADLDNWSYVPKLGQIAVDPVRGRIVFPPRQAPKRGVRVSYHYGFSAPMGGGEYPRPIRQRPGAKPIRVQGKEALQRALEAWRRQKGPDGEDVAPADQPEDAVIEITDSGVYVLPINIFLGKGHSLQIRAALRKRPVIRLLDWQTDLPDNFVIAGLGGSRFILDGILVAGRGIQVERGVRSVTVRHSTLVPGWSLEPNCDPQRPAEPSIELIDSEACVVIEHSIVGSIQVNNDEVVTDPVSLRISDSIVDATGNDCDGPECEAIGAAGSRRAHATAKIWRSTVIGKVMTHAIELAENSLFMGRVTVGRRQLGCMRFCYVRPQSRTPKRFNCQPDLAERTVSAELKDRGASEDEIEAARASARSRVRPQFNSVRYGTPTYCQLAATCAPEIVCGADDESEMGAFHDLFQPQRTANLRARLDEFSPASTDAGILFAT